MTSVGLAMSVFDGGSTIDEALASVEAQTRLPDAIVIVDDGSRDDTAARLDRWRSRLPLDIISRPNGGVASGRTTAVAHLPTDLVLGLDADDVWMPDHLERLTDLHRRHGGIAAPLAVRWRHGHSGRLVARPRHDIESVLVMNSIFAGSLFEREAYLQVGGFFRFDGCEDWDLWLRLLREGVEVHHLPHPTVRYRIDDDSLSADDRGLPTERLVLTTFLEETDDAALRRVARRSLRHRDARLALRRSYELAEQRRFAAARAAATRTMAGPGNVRARGAAMAVAPGFTIRRRAELRDRR